MFLNEMIFKYIKLIPWVNRERVIFSFIATSPLVIEFSPDPDPNFNCLIWFESWDAY